MKKNVLLDFPAPYGTGFRACRPFFHFGQSHRTSLSHLAMSSDLSHHFKTIRQNRAGKT
jgi:hypothetical protein